MAGNYSIQVWSFEIGATGGTARHNFLVLKDAGGNTIRELQGGAAEIGANRKPNGNQQ